MMRCKVSAFLRAAKEGKRFVTEPIEGGTHGYLNTDPRMQAIFIAWGAGIPGGIRLNNIFQSGCCPDHRRAAGSRGEAGDRARNSANRALDKVG